MSHVSHRVQSVSLFCARMAGLSKFVLSVGDCVETLKGKTTPWCMLPLTGVELNHIALDRHKWQRLVNS